MRAVALVALLACGFAHAGYVVTYGDPLRAEFNLQPLEDQAFPLPAGHLAFTLMFNKSGDLFDLGESIRIVAYGPGGGVLGEDTYTAPIGGIFGCACWDIDTMLDSYKFSADIYALPGTSFDLLQINAVAQSLDQRHSTGTIGVPHNVPEPGTLALTGVALVGGLTAHRRRKTAASCVGREGDLVLRHSEVAVGRLERLAGRIGGLSVLTKGVVLWVFFRNASCSPP